MENGKLLAGTAETDITPWLGISLAGHFNDRKASEITDPLKAKAVVLDDGTTQLAMVAVDLIGLPSAEVAAIRENVAARIPLRKENIMIAGTHTHTAPAVRDSNNIRRDAAYCQWMVPKIADAICLAYNRRKPARLAYGKGDLPDHCFCRRYRMKDGTVVTNPGRGNPDVVEPADEIDPLVGVLYLEDPDGKPLAVVGRYSLHYVGTSNAYGVSADYFGHFAKAVRSLFGEDCAVLLFNGNSGQVNNIDVFDPDQEKGLRQSTRVARSLAGEVAKVIGRLRPTADVKLGVARETVRLPRKTITRHDLDLAQELLDANDPNRPAQFDWLVGGPLPEAMRLIYARNTQEIARMPEAFVTEVQCFRIGESAWVALPGEVFVEIGAGIREASPAGETFVVGIANDALGYFASDKAYTEGGYETWAGIGSPVAPSEKILVGTAVECLNRLFDAGRNSRDEAQTAQEV